MEHILTYTVLVLSFCIFGLFGNISVLVAVVKEKSMRTKMGLLMAVHVSLHILCLLEEIIILYANWQNFSFRQNDCFRLVSVYIFACLMQAGIFLAMSIDIMLSITVPFRHRVWSNTRYVAVLCTPPFLFAVSAVIVCARNVSDMQIYMCCPPIVIPREDGRYIGVVLTASNIASVLIIAYAAVQVFRRESSGLRTSRNSRSNGKGDLSTEQKVLRTMTIMCSIFIGSWCLCSFGTFMLIEFKLGGNDSKLKIYLVTLALITYSQNYYILYCRYPRQRKIFRKQLNRLTCGYFFNDQLLVTASRSSELRTYPATPPPRPKKLPTHV